MRLSRSTRSTLGSWTPYVQPEGQLYFVSQGRIARFITEEYLYEREFREDVEQFLRELEQRLRSIDDRGRWNGMDVMLEVQGDQRDILAYYIVDHKSRCVLWLECKDLTSLSSQCWGAESLAHLSTQISFPFGALTNLKHI
jgi:hypothetical protein